MSEERRRKRQRQKLLEAFPYCIYCGDHATTTDHCPPRCFFECRAWPEGYEFPCCSTCNAGDRLDEQACAVLFRTKFNEHESEDNQREWRRLVDGLKNNQPDLIAEWQSIGPVGQKRYYRKTFGYKGDEMRREGFGAVRLGKLTNNAINSFVSKLARALFFKHNGSIFDGVIYCRRISVFEEDDAHKTINEILHLAPTHATLQRNNVVLDRQFFYRFNHSPEVQVMYAVVQFNPQFIFQIIMITHEWAERLEASRKAESLTTTGRIWTGPNLKRANTVQA